ncbi:kinase-like protein [Rickenella mellea]|uniref:Kinase-like protein n=1 Tax=Rickenella mellea TaxID=50990 RepID=A0A4Y7PRU9_9AGAM|nr:kinase-like protein [Rickenella mellea]
MPPRKSPYRTHTLDRQEIKVDDWKPLSLPAAFIGSDSGRRSFTAAEASPIASCIDEFLSSTAMLPSQPSTRSSTLDPTNVAGYAQSLFKRHGLRNSHQRRASEKNVDGGYLRTEDSTVVRDAWKTWWEDYCIDVEAFATTTAYISVSRMSECLTMSRSARIYPRLIAYTYVRLNYPFKFSTARDLNMLREMHAECRGWDDHECLLRHHTIRMKLWDLIGSQREDSESAIPGCRLKCVIGSDMDDIRRMVERVLENRELKDKLLESCIQDPVPVINLLQTLLDDHNPTDSCKRSVVRMMARIAKKSGCYPDCLVLEDVRPVGAHPVAGGGFADVWKGDMGIDPSSTTPVSLKVFRVYNHSAKEKILQRFSHEAVIWRQLKHANILPFYGVYTGGDDFGRLSLISPWMEQGNILDYLGANPNTDRISMLADVARGLEYLHLFEPTVVHGDIKAANVLVTPSTTACLADFGLASLRDSQGSTWDTTTEKAAGTLRWQAPELLLGDENGETILPNRCSDIYSFACLCIEVFTGKAPFMEISRDTVVVMTIMQKKTPKRPTDDLSGIGLDDSMWNIMEQCWQSEPTLRPTIAQVAEYFNGRSGGPRRSLDVAGDLPTGVRGTLGQYGFSDAYVTEIAHKENSIDTIYPQAVDTGALESRIREILDSPLTDLASISANLKHVEKQLGKMNPTLFGNFLSLHKADINLVLSKVLDINASHDSVSYSPDISNEDSRGQIANSNSPLFVSQDLPTLWSLYANGTIIPRTSMTRYPVVKSYLDRISLFMGDITRLQVDAIVTNHFLDSGERIFAADPSLLDSAIHRRAGPRLSDKCRTLGDWEVGSAKITEGYDLPAAHVIHTVGPHYYPDQAAESADCLSSCYRESLNLSADNSLKSIAFPAISTGLQGFPMTDAAEIALLETRSFLDSDQGAMLDLVVFTLFDKASWNVYRDLIPKYFPLVSSTSH